MLDDQNVLKQRDPHGALKTAAKEWQQTRRSVTILEGDHDGRSLANVIIVGMGSSGAAGDFVKTWLGSQLSIPLEIVRNGELPNYVDSATLVVAVSYSGDTEEVLHCLAQARTRSAQVAAISAGGRLALIAKEKSIAHAILPDATPGRLALIDTVRAIVMLLAHFRIVSTETLKELSEAAEWLEEQTKKWLPGVTTAINEAKQLALLAVGKTPVFYGGALTASLACRWKTAWNENAKNVAFWNYYPEAGHAESIGWTSHPINKPFAVFDLVSRLEQPRILASFDLTDRLLSGRRPKAHAIHLQGHTIVQQLLWGYVLADFASIYTAILNGVDPVTAELTEKFKRELA